MTRHIDRQLSRAEHAVALHSAIRTRLVRDTQRSALAPPRVPREFLVALPEPEGADVIASAALLGLTLSSALLMSGSLLTAALCFAATAGLGLVARQRQM